ncbi:MAG: class I SAM-dependent methyltransferase, partial [Acidobacteria bacterium]|nr:class I SAM-dependent methyltransferase [Acidobacteriota bacterium]
ALAVALGARRVDGWSSAEDELTRSLPRVKPSAVALISREIKRGRDPLGTTFCQLRSPDVRRPQGATYTPGEIVRAMIRWAGSIGQPARVVDPGVGSARFLVAAGRQFPTARLVGIDNDPLATLLARAHLSCIGFHDRAAVLLVDYRDVVLPKVAGTTLFIGNPPYVRHHLISAARKAWFVRAASDLGLREASQLAGLHVHFFISTAQKASTGDFGAFITAAEWLDVNYGRVLRDLFIGPLGGRSITLIEPTARLFPDAATTATIACFQAGSRTKSVRLKRVASFQQLKGLEAGRTIRRERLEAAQRWTPLTRASRKEPAGYVELGELCRVHRGQVTGSNKVWIAGSHSTGLPAHVLFASVTRARELFAAGRALTDAAPLKKVIDLPVDLDVLDSVERRAVEMFLKVVRTMGAEHGYIARNRKAWWSVGLRQPAPLLATYMARRPPAFVRNLADARHINIAHGVYPRDPLESSTLDVLANYLTNTVTQAEGRTYAGGLTKFEPKELERLIVPDPSTLSQL